MSLSESLSEVRKAHNAGQEKYTYFLLAAAGAAIGFAVQKTEDQILTWWLLPVALATLSWGISFYFGCKNIERVHASMGANATMLQLRQGIHPDQPSTPQHADDAMAGVGAALERSIVRATVYSIWQFRMLVLGSIFFIAWRVLEIVRLSC